MGPREEGTNPLWGEGGEGEREIREESIKAMTGRDEKARGFQRATHKQRGAKGPRQRGVLVDTQKTKVVDLYREQS